MKPLHPIYTERTECQDCYKCIRECPVKAIRVTDGHAEVMTDRCVLCGHCVNVCPRQAKKVRDDLGRARQLLTRRAAVYVSLAPSYVSEFPQVTPGQMIAALRRLGFAGVSETALGAEEVSAHVAELIQTGGNALHISSACPTVVDYLRMYHPQYAPAVTPLMSPVLAHAKLLKQTFGPEIGIVFISPCIAKKKEADEHPQWLDVALTYEDLRRWLSEEGIDLLNQPTDGSEAFVPRLTGPGALYPIDGGMIAGIKANIREGADRPFYMAISGIHRLGEALADIGQLTDRRPVFFECLACEGGCVNGPQAAERRATGRKRYSVIDRADYHEEKVDHPRQFDLAATFTAGVPGGANYPEAEMRRVLHGLGKYQDRDELNCGGCGYDTCRDLARALLDGRAEPTMCVSYMRKLAHKKAHALLNAMPSGVVIVNASLKILECNANFARLIGPEVEQLYLHSNGLEDAYLPRVVPFSNLFARVMETGEDLIEHDIRFKDTILHGSIFTIERNVLVGGVLQDITVPSVQKEQIIKKSRQVIQQNLETVQKIAYLLGENAAESEVLLNSIIKSLAPAAPIDVREE